MLERPYPDFHGIILINKPVKISSNALLQKVKRLLKAKKAGHTGCLDPLASGMLPICVGEATKFSQYLINADKAYRVTARLGYQSTTGDDEGEKTFIGGADALDSQQFEQSLVNWLGEIEQIPPMYSAVKQDGAPLYKLARKGVTVERKSRRVTIRSLNLLDFSAESFTLDVVCSKGTYIRTLVEDIAKALGTASYVTDLHRQYVAPYCESQMLALKTLNEQVLSKEFTCRASAGIISMHEMLQGMRSILVSDEHAKKLHNGLRVLLDEETQNEDLVVINQASGGFLGVGKIIENQLIPQRLICNPATLGT